MSSSIYDDPDFRAWELAVMTNMLPKLASSSATVSLVPGGRTDAKFAVELGFSIMLDKPILAVVLPGAEIPDKLRLVADLVVEADMGTEEGGKAVQQAITAFLEGLDD